MYGSCAHFILLQCVLWSHSLGSFIKVEANALCALQQLVDDLQDLCLHM
jgi:hypothetical protein